MLLTWRWKLHLPPKRWYPPVTTMLCSKPEVDIIYDLNILCAAVRYEGDIWLVQSFALSFQVGAAERCRIAFLSNYEERTAFNLNIPAQSDVGMEACDTRNSSCNSVNICGSGLLYLYTNTLLKIVLCLKHIRDSDSLYQHSVEYCSLSAVYPRQWFVIPTQCWRLFFAVYPWQWFVIPTQCWILFFVCSISATVIRYTNTVLKIVLCLQYIRDSDSLYQHSVEDCSLSAVYPWQWFVIPIQCWRLFIGCNFSVTLIRYINTVLKTVQYLKYICVIDLLYQHSVEDCSISEVFMCHRSVIPTQCWRLFIVWSTSVTVIRYTHTVLKIVHWL